MQMEGPVQVMALMNSNTVEFGSVSLKVAFQAVRCTVSFLRTAELVNAALELAVLAYAASEAMVLPDQYVEHIKHYFLEISPAKSPRIRLNTFNIGELVAYRLLQSAHARSAMRIDPSVSEDSDMKNEALSVDEVDRPCDECKACAHDMLFPGLVEGADHLCCGGMSDWTVAAAKGKDEVNSNHKAGKPVASGKKDNNSDEDDEDEEDGDDDDVEDEGEGGDEENDNGEGEDDGNEDEEDGDGDGDGDGEGDGDDDDEDEDGEEEEEEEEDEEVEAARVQSARRYLDGNEEDEDDDSDEGEGDEEGVEEEDDLGDEGEDEDGEDGEEDEDEEDEEEDAPEPPRKKNKSS